MMAVTFGLDEGILPTPAYTIVVMAHVSRWLPA